MAEYPITDIVSIPLATTTNDGLFSKEDKQKLNAVVAGGVASFNTRVGAVVPEAGDYTAEDIEETDTRKVLTDVERTKLQNIEENAQVNTVISVHTRVGNVVAAVGDYNAAQISETATKKIMTDAERDKLATVQVNAAPNPSQVSSGEKTAGTENGLRSFSPADIKDIATIWGGGGSGGAVTSVFGRTGNVVSVSGDYTAAQITETATKKIMTDTERTKLAGIADNASAAGATGDAHAAATGNPHGTTAAQVGADAAGTAAGLVGALTPTSIGAASASHTHAQSDITDLTSALTAKAPLASPTFTGTPSAPTAATSANSTQIATTAFVKSLGYVTSIPVTSVAGKTGAVTLNGSDIGLGNVTNDAQLLKSMSYTTKSSPAAGDKIVIKDQSDGLPKVIDWNQLPTAAVGSAANPPELEYCFATNNLTWTAMPAAATEFGGGQNRKRVNLTAAAKLRVQVIKTVVGATGSYLRPQYSTLTNPSTADTDWTDFDATALDLTLVGTGTIATSQINVPSAAQIANVWVRFKGAGGDGTASPTVRGLSMMFELVALKGVKGDKGDPGDAGSAITTTASMSAGGDPPNADAVNLTNTEAITVNMPAVTSGRTAISFRLAKSGGGNVTFQGGSGRSIDGGSFTASHGTATAPIVYTFVSNPDSPTQWLRWAR